MNRKFVELEKILIELARSCSARGWTFATSGNFSAVVTRDPFCMLITPSGLDKGSLSPGQFVRVNSNATEGKRSRRPSAETDLHLMVVRLRGAGAVLHTHSVWSTIVSCFGAAQAGVEIEGYEMLKGLRGVSSHRHREWLPIVANRQDIEKLSVTVEKTLRRHPDAHGFLVQGHGLYTWGENLAEAKRHLETLEFLLEVLGHTRFAPTRRAIEGMKIS